MEGCQIGDERLGKRARTMIGQMAARVGASIPSACQDWANTKAAYRFFSNEAVSGTEILGGHFAAARERMAVAGERVLVLHDTTEFSCQRESESALGLLKRLPGRRDQYGRLREITPRGILMHSSLVATPEGLPLGLAAIRFWTRKRFKGCNALKGKVNPARAPIEQKESFRWLENIRQATALANDPADCVHIGDRESDIHELFCTAAELRTHFLVRTCVDRLAGPEGETIADAMGRASIRGVHRIAFKDRKGADCEAVLEIKFRQIKVHPPIGKQSRYPALRLTVIHALERGTPEGRERIEWKLVTSLPVGTRAEAVEKLDWYAMRWKTGIFHKILKSGCKAEESGLRTSERLASFIALCCIVSWRIFWMTMPRRIAPDASPAAALSETEILLLDTLAKAKPAAPPTDGTLADYLLTIARLGGCLARASDPPPGNIVLWRGLSRLTDIQLGFSLGSQLVGN